MDRETFRPGTPECSRGSPPSRFPSTVPRSSSAMAARGRRRAPARGSAHVGDLASRGPSGGRGRLLRDLPGSARLRQVEQAVQTADHAPYSKRAMARDIVQVLQALGHDTFSVVGHDRGSYVALRLALDHPAAIERLVLIDCLPISGHLRRCTAEFAADWWHWFFFAQPDTPSGSSMPIRMPGTTATERRWRGESRRAARGVPQPRDRARDAGGLSRRPRHRPRE